MPVNHPLYGLWRSMRHRCHNAARADYPLYGGRGIEVCEKWRWDFRAFVSDVGERPSPKHTLDRLRGDGNYEPGNVRWATAKEQCRNRRGNRFIEWRGARRTVAECAELAGLPQDTVHHRLDAGWSVDRALTTPLGATSHGRSRLGLVAP